MGMTNTRPAPAGSPCDANDGRCDELATVDFGRHVQVAGIPGKVRRLCCVHARGTKGHRKVCPVHAEADR